ncbi:hypothetical protein [Alcanivorax sp.]|uniref:hypothetical protein n=1 Tax=Alcanivorax sp. TaxID=1872427 RepID=UPI0032D8EA32
MAKPDIQPHDSVDTLRTGDLLLFSGRGFTSDVIRVFTRSPWSHIGMVLHLPGQPEPLVLESTTLSESPDITLGHPVAGVALVPLYSKIRDYPGAVAVRRRHGPNLSERQQRMVARMARRLLHRPYKNYVLCNALDVLTGFTRRPDQRGWFCSELVAELYRRLGWLPLDTRSSTLVPGHFGSRHMRLQHGKLGPVEWLKSELPHPVLCEADDALTASGAPSACMPAIAHQTAGHETFLPPRSHVAG